MKVIIEGNPKEIADLVLALQSQLSSDEVSSYLGKVQGKLEEIVLNKITEGISSAIRDNA